MVRSDGLSEAPVLYRGENAINVFLGSLKDELRAIKENLSNIASIVMTPDDGNAFRMANDCHICGEEQVMTGSETIVILRVNTVGQPIMSVF